MDNAIPGINETSTIEQSAFRGGLVRACDHDCLKQKVNKTEPPLRGISTNQNDSIRL